MCLDKVLIHQKIGVLQSEATEAVFKHHDLANYTHGVAGK